MKDKVLILCSTPNRNFINYGKYKYIIGFKKYLDLIAVSPNVKIEILESIITGRNYRMCDHLSAIAADKIISRITSEKTMNFLKYFGGEKYSKFILIRSLNIELAKIYRTFLLIKKIKKIKKNYINNSNIDFIPEFFSIKIFKESSFFKKYKNYKIPKLLWMYMCFYELVKNLYCFLMTLLSPEQFVFKMKKNHNKKIVKKKYSISYILSSGQYFNTDPLIKSFDTLSLKGNESNYSLNIENIIFVADNTNDKNWIKKVKESNQKNYSLVVLDEIVNKFSKIEYITKIYIKVFRLRLKLIYLSFFNFNYSVVFYKIINDFVYWNLFYQYFEVNLSIRSMIAGSVTSNIIQKYYNTKTSFFYYSHHGQIVGKKIKKNFTEYIQYSNLIFDYLLSSDFSNNWFEYQQNKIGSYVSIGSINSDRILFIKKNLKNTLRDKLNISKNKILISFFDHSCGYMGMADAKSYKDFLLSIKKLIEQFPEYLFLFKSKQEIPYYKDNLNKETYILFNQIIHSNHCIYANTLNLKSQELMGISDLIVSSAYSSINYEGICAGIRTIVYDPNNNYNESFIPFVNFPNFKAKNHIELKKLINHWMDTNDSDLKKFVIDNINKEIDKNSYGKSYKAIFNFLH